MKTKLLCKKHKPVSDKILSINQRILDPVHFDKKFKSKSFCKIPQSCSVYVRRSEEHWFLLRDSYNKIFNGFDFLRINSKFEIPQSMWSYPLPCTFACLPQFPKILNLSPDFSTIPEKIPQPFFSGAWSADCRRSHRLSFSRRPPPPPPPMRCLRSGDPSIYFLLSVHGICS